MRIALFEPEIPQNTGTILRMAACFGVGVDIIEPLGFIWNHPQFRRSVMDYLDVVDVVRHLDFLAFQKATPGRIIPVVVTGKTSFYDFSFDPSDTLLFGKESTGLPPHLLNDFPQSLYIPMKGHGRSLNLAMAVGVVTSEALRKK